jgi:hypothetical protein
MRLNLHQLGGHSLMEAELIRLEHAFRAVSIEPTPSPEPTVRDDGRDIADLEAGMQREVEGMLQSLHKLRESTKSTRESIQDRPNLKDEKAALGAVEDALRSFFDSAGAIQ